MLDAKTISATLTIALLGCASGANPPTTPDGAPTAAPTTAAPTAPATGSPSTPAGGTDTHAAKPEGNQAAMALPAGRPEPMPPMDGKVRKGTESTRKGAAACCGEGTCGPCNPLPSGRAAPMPPKDGKVPAPAKSARKGAAACCGEGTCSPCLRPSPEQPRGEIRGVAALAPGGQRWP